MNINPTRRSALARGPAAMVTLAAVVIVLLPSVGLAAQSAATQTAPLINTKTVSGVAQRRIPSVVFIHVESAGGDLVNVGEPPAAESVGSGVIIDPTGLIVANAHVVGNAPSVHVEDADGRRFEAEVVARDAYSDLALIRPGIGVTWRPAPLGRSGSLTIGNWVIAIGNPLGLHHTVTLGIVSGLARSLRDDMPELIQTDVAVNPGSSGGGLFNLDGNLVGITSGSYSTSGGSMGLNFAIPVDLLRDVLPQLKTGGVAWGWIGLTTVPLATPQTGGLHGTPGPIRTRVVNVVDGGPASMARARPCVCKS